MSMTHIKQSFESVVAHYAENPDKARSWGIPVTAVMEEGLRCRVEKQGETVTVTDMSTGIGGGGTAPSPGLLSMAALASCDATLFTIRAAQEGLNLTALEVTVDCESDSRGLLGLDDTIPPGNLNVRIRFRIGAKNATPERLREIVEDVVAHSPVGDDVSRAVPLQVEVEVV